ncbi:hypothetical protein QTN25_008085 [Entamoeba marina]
MMSNKTQNVIKAIEFKIGKILTKHPNIKYLEPYINTKYYDNFDVCFVEYLIEFNRNIHDESYLGIKVLDRVVVSNSSRSVTISYDIRIDRFKGCLRALKSMRKFEKAIMKIYPNTKHIEVKLCDKDINKSDKELFEF